MTHAERLRFIGHDLAIWHEREDAAACLAGADALDRLAQTCGNCQHGTDEHAVTLGWGHCTAPAGPRFPFAHQAMPLDERCKGWTPREDE